MSRPDFTGTWKLDLKASDSFDAVLKAQGISAIERKVLNTLQITHIILQKEDWIQLTIKTPIRSKTHEFILDGSLSEIESRRVGRIQGKNFWDDEQSAWILVAQMEVNKSPVEVITTRTLDPKKDVMQMQVQANQVQPDQGQMSSSQTSFIANRFFYRVN